MALDAKIFTGKVREGVGNLQNISYGSSQGVLEFFMKQETLSRLKTLLLRKGKMQL